MRLTPTTYHLHVFLTSQSNKLEEYIFNPGPISPCDVNGRLAQASAQTAITKSSIIYTGLLSGDVYIPTREQVFHDLIPTP